MANSLELSRLLSIFRQRANDVVVVVDSKTVRCGRELVYIHHSVVCLAIILLHRLSLCVHIGKGGNSLVIKCMQVVTRRSIWALSWSIDRVLFSPVFNRFLKIIQFLEIYLFCHYKNDDRDVR